MKVRIENGFMYGKVYIKHFKNAPITVREYMDALRDLPSVSVINEGTLGVDVKPCCMMEFDSGTRVFACE